MELKPFSNDIPIRTNEAVPDNEVWFGPDHLIVKIASGFPLSEDEKKQVMIIKNFTI